MKKLTVLAVAILLFSGMLEAQVRFGVKAGVNGSTFFTESNVADDITPGINFQIGGLMQYDFWIFTLQPELLYSVRSARMDNANDKYLLEQYANLTEADPELRYTSQNIEIPVNLQYGVNIGKKRVFVEVGPYVSFHLGGSFNGEASLYKDYNSVYSFNKVDFGVGAGAGVEYKKFQLTAKYDWGLNWLGKEVDNYTETNANVFYDMKYMNLALSLAYIF
jgi:hypothetical protein